MKIQQMPPANAGMHAVERALRGNWREIPFGAQIELTASIAIKGLKQQERGVVESRESHVRHGMDPDGYAALVQFPERLEEVALCLIERVRLHAVAK